MQPGGEAGDGPGQVHGHREHGVLNRMHIRGGDGCTGHGVNTKEIANAAAAAARKTNERQMTQQEVHEQKLVLAACK